jgi:phosphate transport system substrate-binding protein
MKKRLLVLLVVILAVVPFVNVGAQDQTIVEIAAGNPDFSTLVELVTAAGLVETLSGEGPFTVFAPTNDAFAALPSTVVEYLGSHPDALTRVLTYHVLPAEVMAETAMGMMEPAEVATVEGSNITVVYDGTNVRVNDATVVAADVDASNGVIHIIDTVLVPAFELPEVTPATLTGDIAIDGSSTVEPLTVAVANRFTNDGFGGNVTVGESGTGGGFKAFCEEGVTDISNASRPIKMGEGEEFSKCEAIGRNALGFRVGTDGLSVVVSSTNDFVTDVTFEELQAIFSTAVNWSDVRAEWPAEPIVRYMPGTDSGTWDYFIEAVFDKAPEPALAASNINQSENDNVLVQGVQSSPYAVGFFGYAYYQANAATLKALSIDGVGPTASSVEDGSYLLARPLFIYSDPTIMQEKPQVAGFIAYYLTVLPEVIGEVGYFPSSQFTANKAALWWVAATGGM